jgi:hypothetical protein
MEIKIKKTIATLILIFNLNYIEADDYVWGEEFVEGDVISAATFNQIFGTLQKLNRTPVDADLVGTWFCNAITTRNTDGWTNKGAFYQLTNAQVTFTSSGSSSSIESPYAISTSAPSPFKRTSGAFSGVYSLFDNMIFTKISGETDSRIFLVDIKSETKIDFIFQETSAQSFPANYASYISCNSAAPVPAAPTATIATNAQTVVNVTWTDHSSDETGFKIYRRLSTETEATQLATALTASPYVDSTLTEGQTAYYSVSAYNANGESAKSRVVAATLDSVKPTVVSHVPSANQQVDRTVRSHVNLSITFSEAVKIICPAGGNGPSCSTAGFAITAVGTKSNDELSNYNYEFPVSGAPFVSAITVGQSGIVFSGNLTPTYNLPREDTITVTVHKEWIQDANGNQMAADYTYTYTTGS